MEVNPIAPAATSGADRALASLADNFDNFLILLTTQLQNQDPLDPLDSNEFVAQLVSFTGVEQAVNTNTNLEALIGLFKLNQTTAAVSYLGTIVEATGDTTTLAGGQATFRYHLPETVASTGILITNDQGQVVYAGIGETAAGDHAFVWDGRDLNGIAQTEGVYKINLSARDMEDKIVPVATTISGRVTGIETLDGGLVLVVNGIGVPFENIVSVVEGDAPPTLPQ